MITLKPTRHASTQYWDMPWQPWNLHVTPLNTSLLREAMTTLTPTRHTSILRQAMTTLKPTHHTSIQYWDKLWQAWNLHVTSLYNITETSHDNLETYMSHLYTILLRQAMTTLKPTRHTSIQYWDKPWQPWILHVTPLYNTETSHGNLETYTSHLQYWDKPWQTWHLHITPLILRQAMTTLKHLGHTSIQYWDKPWQPWNLHVTHLHNTETSHDNLETYTSHLYINTAWDSLHSGITGILFLPWPLNL